jgi:competence protein ComEC
MHTARLAGLASLVFVSALVFGLRQQLPDRAFSALVKILCLSGLALLVSARAASMLAEAPVAIGPKSFVATLKTDPTSQNGISTAVAEIEGNRFRLSARGSAGASLGNFAAGERVAGRGSFRVVSRRSWRIAKHLVADVDVERVWKVSSGTHVAQLANSIRAQLLGSSAHFNSTDRALFSGFVLGDARDQPVWVADEFRAAGLTHLLVVSGQNVAFVLAVARPLLLRLRRRKRFVVTLVILFLFAVVTRFEPSVQRAAVMAALSSGSLTIGRPQRSLRILALTVCVLLMYDPLLAWSVGFGLSVGACFGLAVITPRLEAIDRGPQWLRTPLATTVGAQCGASLVMIPIFGGVPVVSILANVLALPAAEPVMSWGIAAGLPAGTIGNALGDWPSRLVHLPTQACLWWVQLVARVCAQLPLGQFSPVHLVGGVVGILLLKHGASKRMVVVVGVLTFLTPMLQLWSRPETSSVQGVSLARSASGWGLQGSVVRTLDILVLDHGTSVADVLEGLRQKRVEAIDLIVVRGGGRTQRDVIRAIAARRDVGAVMVANRSFAGSVRPVIEARPETAVQSGAWIVRVESVTEGRLQLLVARRPA